MVDLPATEVGSAHAPPLALARGLADECALPRAHEYPNAAHQSVLPDPSRRHSLVAGTDRPSALAAHGSGPGSSRNRRTSRLQIDSRGRENKRAGRASRQTRAAITPSTRSRRGAARPGTTPPRSRAGPMTATRTGHGPSG